MVQRLSASECIHFVINWATVNWSWLKEWNECAQGNLRFKKTTTTTKNQTNTGGEWVVVHSPQFLASEGKTQQLIE